MRQSTSLLFKRFVEYLPASDVETLPPGIRGIYALYQGDQSGHRNLMYVGMTAGGAKGRIHRHSAGKKADKWTHCSVFEVWDNITDEQIRELEALLRHLLRLDATASSLNLQRGSSIFRRLRKESRTSDI